MGTFSWLLRISSMDGQQAQDIEATVTPGPPPPRCPPSSFGSWGSGRVESALSCWPTGGGSRWKSGELGPRLMAQAKLPLWYSEKMTLPPCWGPTPWKGGGPGGGPHVAATRSHPPHHVLNPPRLMTVGVGW